MSFEVFPGLGIVGTGQGTLCNRVGVLLWSRGGFSGGVMTKGFVGG